MIIYKVLDQFFIYFHLLFSLFNLFGWIFKKTRLLHLATLLITAFSWFILGIWYGIGYCPLTDWHWQVRVKLGIYDMPNSYIKFLIDEITGMNSDANLVDNLVFTSFVVAVLCSIISNGLDFYRKIKPKEQ
ncbi:MAG: DUF2784 domain-containing protein [Bacteriovoracaceae bacterium]|nr:DUF2784 domain-containing protein [Bacteriovoracaceae bacterium]